MARNYFQFKQFTVFQDRCAMKVGTDGTLLGAWANAPAGSARILDIGTGTGLIALMMAQRFPMCHITAIDIDEDAVAQAKGNIQQSPFSSRMNVIHADIRNFHDGTLYDAIVCNPPYFEHSLLCPDSKRTTARHTTSLNYRELLVSAFNLLKDNGIFSIIIPDNSKSHMESEACILGFFPARVTAIRTTPQKPPKRFLMEYRKHPSSQPAMDEEMMNQEPPHEHTGWYQSLVKDFYI